MCVLRGDILGPFYPYRQGAPFCHYYFINRLGETLSCNGLRQIGLISFKWGSLFGALSVDSKQQISFGVSSVVYGILLLSHGCCSFNQYDLQDRILRLNSNPTLYWGGWCHVSANSHAHMLLSYHFGYFDLHHFCDINF